MRRRSPSAASAPPRSRCSWGGLRHCDGCGRRRSIDATRRVGAAGRADRPRDGRRVRASEASGARRSHCARHRHLGFRHALLGGGEERRLLCGAHRRDARRHLRLHLLGAAARCERTVPRRRVRAKRVVLRRPRRHLAAGRRVRAAPCGYRLRPRDFRQRHSRDDPSGGSTASSSTSHRPGTRRSRGGCR